MAQIKLDQATETRLKNKVGNKHFTRVSHFHPSIETEKIGATIDGEFVVVEFENGATVLRYTVKPVNKVLN
jgi:hypothetical protein